MPNCYEPEQVCQRGLADLVALAHQIQVPFLFGDPPHRIDAGVYGFLANIHFYAIDTPLKQFVAGTPRLADYIELMHRTVAEHLR